jgi:hypothetical protein
MTQRTLDGKKRVHLWMNIRDLERIAVAYPRMKQSEVIRTIVKKTLDALEAQAGKSRKIPHAEMEL